ncbi:hypothetical protein PVL29_015105 [Vitis rotundifolia]|uniref:Receptor-like serine/threonine-protein kinase n=1 Tax=Vitis rotundifolia TaxID=103349 RepID=A0AA38ZBQ1_VITRO|nr:hypothetical protein PVL29_015105 [Vitis rotundifolia]
MDCVLQCLILFIASFHLAYAESIYYSVANLSSSWTNNPVPGEYVGYDRSELMPILLRPNEGPTSFVCGFYCNYDCDGYLFAVLIFPTMNVTVGRHPRIIYPRVVWSANRHALVSVNATLELTPEGDLILREANGAEVWSTHTSGKSVVGLSLNETGNLVLFDCNNSSVWQSFDHPTDSLVPGQKLALGAKLTASVSKKDWSQGLISFSVYSDGLVACVESNPPQIYSYRHFDYSGVIKEPSHVIFKNEGLFLSSGRRIWPFFSASSPLYLKLEPKGQVTVYEWVWNEYDWKVYGDSFLANYDCEYPLICGKYGVCSVGQCGCPGPNGGETVYFRPINFKQPDLGCSEITSLTCEASQYHSLLELNDIIYFPVVNEYGIDYDIESCKQACLENCSCKAAIFTHGEPGYCHLPSEIFSLALMNTETYPFSNSTTFIKVQNVPKEGPPAPVIDPAPIPPSSMKTSRIEVILASCFGAFFVMFLVVIIIWHSLFLKRKDSKEDEEDFLKQVPGVPIRFSNESLVVATENFSQKLGEGGFGSVFKGILRDGTKVAVKCLDGLVGRKDSFLAEVETIGGIHHMNLVRLVGYCATKSNQSLVYEYMCNGSLDKWIFRRSQELALDWQTRRKIILDVAKGLAYLHGDCQKKIVHFDIKPQNILLDENFNAKVSDFGLSKLIDKDQSLVVTTLRGTVGYLAPEWLSSTITEKIDVYSFGVVMLEILCGRKNLDRSQPEEDMHLLNVFKKKAKEDQLLDLVDKSSEDMLFHGIEVVEMMKLAAWCLQNDTACRPSMSVVVKVLEGVMDFEDNLDYSFLNPQISRAMEAVHNSNDVAVTASLVLPSILSGPR